MDVSTHSIRGRESRGGMVGFAMTAHMGAIPSISSLMNLQPHREPHRALRHHFTGDVRGHVQGFDGQQPL